MSILYSVSVFYFKQFEHLLNNNGEITFGWKCVQSSTKYRIKPFLFYLFFNCMFEELLNDACNYFRLWVTKKEEKKKRYFDNRQPTTCSVRFSMEIKQLISNQRHALASGYMCNFTNNKMYIGKKPSAVCITNRPKQYTKAFHLKRIRIQVSKYSEL